MSYVPGPVDSTSSEQHCYRHADRRAGVTCQRCNRPICPSCMVNASVGFQCPECAKQGAKQQRLVDAFMKETTPRVTYGLIAVNVAIFVLGNLLAIRVGGTPVNVRFGLFRAGVADGQWWRLITSGFLHVNLLHVAANMYALYSVGRILERFIGPIRFGLIYAVSLIGGSLGVILLEQPNALTVGASGAIFGIFAAFAVFQMSRGLSPFANGMGLTLVVNLVITFNFSGISIGGHLGGLVTGAACAAILIGTNQAQARQRDRQIPVTAGIVAAIGVVLFVASIVAAKSLPLI